MKVIAGLGNPEKKYEQTRHNVGFMVIDELSKRLNISLNESKFNGIYGIGHFSNEKILLIKPLTFMNLSGECIRPLLNYYNVPTEQLVVIYDDLDLPVGKIRLRMKGSAGGHNGMKSIIQHLGSEDFKRIRIGIGRPKHAMDIVDYVLGKFTEEEMHHIQHSVDRSASACEKWIHTPFLEVMNEYN